MSELLKTEHLSVSFFTDADEVEAVRDVSFTVRKGEVLAIVGESGCGKSALCKSIMKLLPKTAKIKSGKILVNGVDITDYTEKNMSRLRGELFSMVFQDPMTGTAATMMIEENLALAKRRGCHRTLRPGIKHSERQEYRELLKILDLGLEDRMTSKVGLLSGGQRQALTLLMATLKKPKLLLLDEHTAALDPKTAAKVLDTTEKIVKRDHLTTLMITHNMKDAIAHGNRLIMMKDGKIILDIRGEEKKKLTVEDLLHKFEEVSGEEFSNDKAILG